MGAESSLDRCCLSERTARMRKIVRSKFVGQRRGVSPLKVRPGSDCLDSANGVHVQSLNSINGNDESVRHKILSDIVRGGGKSQPPLRHHPVNRTPGDDLKNNSSSTEPQSEEIWSSNHELSQPRSPLRSRTQPAISVRKEVVFPSPDSPQASTTSRVSTSCERKLLRLELVAVEVDVLTESLQNLIKKPGLPRRRFLGAVQPS